VLLSSSHAPLPLELSPPPLHDALPISVENHHPSVVAPRDVREMLQIRAGTQRARHDFDVRIAQRNFGRDKLDRHRVFRAHAANRSEEHTSELQSLTNLVCRLLLEKKKT